MLKTVYRSSCRDKHNCQRHDSNLDPLTPQSDVLTTRLLRPAQQLLSGSTAAGHDTLVYTLTPRLPRCSDDVGWNRKELQCQCYARLLSGILHPEQEAIQNYSQSWASTPLEHWGGVAGRALKTRDSRRCKRRGEWGLCPFPENL